MGDGGQVGVLDGGIALPAGLRRIGISLCLSLLLHLVVLAGLPVGRGRDSGLTDSSLHLEVRLDRPVAATESGGEPEPQGRPGQSSAEVPVATGLPLSDDVGPPYPPREPLYQPAGRVDVMPRPLSSIDAVVDSLGGADGAGRMVLILLVDADGRVREVLLESSSLSATFSEAAVRAFGEIRFTPGVSNGRAVPTRLRIEVAAGYQRDISDGADRSMAGEKR